MNRAALNTDEQVLCSKMYNLLTLFPKVVWMDLVIGLFSALKRIHSVISLMAVQHSHQQRMDASLSPHPHQESVVIHFLSLVYTNLGRIKSQSDAHLHVPGG